MGRKSNYKWSKRAFKFLYVDGFKERMQLQFGNKRKFWRWVWHNQE